MNCRAPYETDQEVYTAMRPPNNMPHNAAAAAAAAAAAMQQANTVAPGAAAANYAQYNIQPVAAAAAGFMPMNSYVSPGGGGVGIGGGGGLSPNSKLSVNASEFVPHQGNLGMPGGNGMGGVAGGVQNRLHAYTHQQQQAFYGQQQQAQQQQRHSYYNGYQQDPNPFNAQQQQQQYQYNNALQNVTASLQDRLRINNAPKHTGAVGGGGGSGGSIGGGGSGGSIGGASGSNNYYQQQSQQQTQHHTKQFQKHPHLNHYQPQQQQHRQPHHHHHQQQQQHSNNHHSQHHHHHSQPTHSQHHHHHQQQQHSTSSSSQQYFANSSNSSSSTNDQTSNSSHPDMEVIALEYLDTVIHCLNQNPGQFDTIASRFLTIFDGMETNNYVLSIAMEDIFEKSIENPNFRYMGAKLYNLLHMMNPKKDSLFHTLLKCKLDYHQNDVKQFMESNQQHKVRETALFLAELYMQLRGDDSRIHLIAENIVYSLKKLLERETSDNVRCICLTLKLAGYDLTADCPDDMKKIIAKLDEINVSSPGKYPLAANVISLQKNNWGRKVSNSLGDGDSAKPPEPPRLSDDPVFYGPDGRELTAEESDFLAGGAAGGPASDDEDGDDLDCDLDPEMDEETERAYNEFCKQQKAQRKNS